MSVFVLPRSTHLLENSEGSFSGLLESDALMISFLQRLLRALAATPNSLGVKLEIRPTGIHVVQLGTALVTPEDDIKS